jgi:hypothetical protein
MRKAAHLQQQHLMQTLITGASNACQHALLEGIESMRDCGRTGQQHAANASLQATTTKLCFSHPALQLLDTYTLAERSTGPLEMHCGCANH